MSAETPFDMRVLTDRGVEVFPVIYWPDRSTVGQHWNDIKHFLATGDVGPLDRYQGVKVLGRRLQADPDEIERWARQGELEFEDIYTSNI